MALTNFQPQTKEQAMKNVPSYQNVKNYLTEDHQAIMQKRLDNAHVPKHEFLMRNNISGDDLKKAQIAALRGLRTKYPTGKIVN